MANGSGITLTALSALSAALLGWIGLGMNQQKNRAEENARLTQVALGRLAEERQRVAGQRDIELKVYDAVVSALETGSERRQNLSRYLANTMVADTALLRGLLEALQLQGAPSVQKAAAEDLAFDHSTQSTKATAAGAPGNGISRVDLFWCESSGPGARQTMETARAELSKEFPAGAVRVRQLPRSINARPSYGVFGYQLRLERGEERAGELVRQEVARAAGGNAEVALVPVGTKTPGYLSAFACP